MTRRALANEGTRVRRLIEKLGRTRRNQRIPREIRSRACAYLRERRAAGASWAAVAEEIGVRPKTVQRWVASEQSARGPNRSRLLPVTVKGPVPTATTRTGMTLVLANGVRLEGVGVEEALRLLDELR